MMCQIVWVLLILYFIAAAVLLIHAKSFEGEKVSWFSVFRVLRTNGEVLVWSMALQIQKFSHIVQFSDM